MDCQAVDISRPSVFFRFMQRLRALVHLTRLHTGSADTKLDIEVMSDYMKRDLGFLDGRDPRQDSDLTR